MRIVMGEADRPKRPTRKVIRRGPSPKAKVPPTLKMDMEKATWGPENVETMPAAVGWYMEEPIEPRTMKTRRSGKVGATPTREMKVIVKSGPPRTKSRVR